MLLNATFNNISVISWGSVLLVEEIGVPGENFWPATSQSDKLTFYNIMYNECHVWGHISTKQSAYSLQNP